MKCLLVIVAFTALVIGVRRSNGKLILEAQS